MTTPKGPEARPASPLLARIANNPLLIDENSADLFRASVEYIAAHGQLVLAASSDDDFWPTDPNDWMHDYRPYIVKDGVLQIPVQGVLLHRFPYQVGGWATGYAYIEKAVERGVADPQVKGIALVVDSPGGEVAGCFELADKIYGLRGAKQIRAFAADSAYSAAFALASSTSLLTVTRSGGVGSVGVVTAHVDYSGALDKAGVKVTFIFAGKHKVDGNPYEALSESARDRIQTRIDKLYGVFVSTVARNRSMSEDAVRNTEALCYDAEDAISVKFADRIGSLDDETSRFAEELNTTETDQMTTTPTDPTASAAQIDAARAEGNSQGAAAERARIRAIMQSPEAVARPAAAAKMALSDKLSALDASTVIEMLADMPEEKAKVEDQTPPAPKDKPKGTPFNTAMDGTPNPNIRTEDAGGEGDEMASESAGILAASRASTGIKPKPRASH